MQTKHSKGFTLLEILLVIAAIGILAAIVLVAINPNRQLSQARNAQRRADINTIYKALEQYLIDKGSYPNSINTTFKEICNTGAEQVVGGATYCGDKADLRALVPTYLASIPTAPSGGIYQVGINTNNNRIGVVAVGNNTELNQTIAINQAIDQYSSNNSILLNFNGTVGSNAAPLDTSGNSLTLTVEGTASNFSISNTQFKYGQAGFFDNGARVLVPATSLLSFPADFELQMWFYMLSRSSYATILELGSYSSGIMIRPGTGDPGIWINGLQLGGSTLNALSLNAWHHLAISRIGTTVKIYVNGTQMHEAQGISSVINSGAGTTYIGDSTHAPGRFFHGYIDDFRIKKGVSTITGNFTPTGPLQ